MTNTLGTNIAKLRESKKLTQEELGKLSGVSRVSIYKIETGQSTPRDTTLQHIAEALHTTPSALRSNQNESPTPQLDQVKELYGDQGAEEVNELFAKNVGLFAGGKLSAKDAYYRALTQAYLDCRAAAESEKKDSEN